MTPGLAKVSIVAGMPTPQGLSPGTQMPSSSTLFMKLLKEQGFDVEIVVPKDDREYVDLNSAEIWLPLLVFAAQPVWDLTVRSLVGAIKSFFAQRKVDATEDVELPPALLHLKCSFEQADGSRRAFEAHGSPSDVVKSLRAFGNVE